MLCDVLPIDGCHLLLGRPWLFDNHVIYDGHANTYSLKHNGCSLTLTPLPPPKPPIIKLNKGREKNLHKSKILDESAASKRKPQIALLMVKPNTSEVLNPFCCMPSIPPHINGVKFMLDSLLRDPCQVNYL